MGQTSFAGVARRVLALPTMWWIIASGALHNFNMYALGQFIASFLIRYHGLNVKLAGWISGVGGPISGRPSCEWGTMTPCHWMAVGSGRLLVTVMATRSPS